MSLAPGTTLGPYEVVGLLGAGGMGEVYRARDTRLDRAVAIKALPEAYALHSERLARFEREAKLLASLSHPNVAGIHGLERVDGRIYLILEFVEGETLAARLRRGPLPVKDTLAVGRQVAAALEAAHESGIIHRDLKPGNVMLRPDGEVKVLDFGLAKGVEGTSASDPGLSASPTMTFAATGVGVILGTAAYMSPEQARGKGVDRRTDIWAFGCVLYECLTGRQVFEGETVSDLIARILEREPDWKGLPASTPPAVRELLTRCLEKDPKQRLRDIGDARLVLEREIATGSSSGRMAVDPAVAAARRRALARTALTIAGGAVLGAIGWALIAPRLPGARRHASPITHLSIDFPTDPRIVDGEWTPDGRAFVLVGVPKSAESQGENGARLYVRPSDGFEIRLLPGTEGVTGFFIAPDSRWIYARVPLEPNSSQARLVRVPIDGSVPPVTVVAWDPAWRSFAVLDSGDLLMLDREGRRLFRRPRAGGAVRESAVDRGDLRATLGLSRPLPGDGGVLVTANVYRERGWGVEVGVIDLRRNKLKMLGLDGGNALWSRTGHLLFSRGEMLLAVPFDPKSLALRGSPVAVASGLRAPFSYVPGLFGLGPDGTLMYVPGGAVGNERRLGIVDAAGKLRPLPFDARPYQGWAAPSADGHTFAVRITNAEGIDEIWAGDLERPGLRRIVSWPSADCASLVPSADGHLVAYIRMGRDTQDGVYVVSLQGAGAGTRIAAPESSNVELRPEAWSRDGQWLTIHREVAGGQGDLWLARLAPGRDSATFVRPLLVTPYEEQASSFSPNGRWLAYHSDESGRAEIYVAPFADGTLGRSVRVTEQGGTVPEWIDDRRIEFRSLDSRTVSVIDVGATPGSGVHAVREWFRFETLGLTDSAVMPDGRALVVLRGPNETESSPAINLVLGWADGLRRRFAKER